MLFPANHGLFSWACQRKMYDESFPCFNSQLLKYSMAISLNFHTEYICAILCQLLNVVNWIWRFVMFFSFCGYHDAYVQLLSRRYDFRRVENRFKSLPDIFADRLTEQNRIVRAWYWALGFGVLANVCQWNCDRFIWFICACVFVKCDIVTVTKDYICTVVFSSAYLLVLHSIRFHVHFNFILYIRNLMRTLLQCAK